MKKVTMIVFILLFSGFLFFQTSSEAWSKDVNPSSQKEENANFSIDSLKNQEISLNGNWEFYWNQWLTPKTIKKMNNKPDHIQVPSSWQGQIIDDQSLPNFGFATYRLQFQIPPEDIGKKKALYLQYIGSAYKLWIDGHLKEVNGVIGENEKTEKPKLRMKTAFFEPEKETVEIVIQVSNFSFREGGIIGDVLYSDADARISALLLTYSKTIFIISGFFFLGVYHLIIFSIRKHETAILLIGLIGISAAVRTLFVNEQVVYFFAPNAQFELMVKIEYIAGVLAFICAVLLMKHLYPKESQQLLVRIAYGYSVVSTSFILINPPNVFTKLLLFHVLIMSGLLCYFVFYVGILAALRKREGARVTLIALFVNVIGMCHDALYFIKMIHTRPILDYTALAFFLLQAVVVSYRYSLLFTKNKALTEDLIEINQTLEEKVAERTKELQKINYELFQRATTDELTSLYNRRYLIDEVRKSFLDETKTAFSFMLLDIDNFKKINNTYGHITGDHVLVTFAGLLEKACEGKALIGRVGGEEFAVFLSNQNEEKSLELAENLRAFIEKSEILISAEEPLFITVSIGLAYTKQKRMTFKELYQCADMALYTSKESGKNKVTVNRIEECTKEETLIK